MQRTKDWVLTLRGSDDLRVTRYSDPSFQTERYNFHSQSGWIITLNGGEFSWKCSKHETVDDSTCELEYIVAGEASKDAICPNNFIGDLGIVLAVKVLMNIFYDN